VSTEWLTRDKGTGDWSVYVQIPYVEVLAGHRKIGRTPGIDPSGQRILGFIGHADRIGKTVSLHDRQHRSKDFLLGHTDIDKHRRPDKISILICGALHEELAFFEAE
jgi:hypothetical protein